MTLAEDLRRQGWGILSSPLSWWLSGGQETGFSTTQISLLAAVLGTAGIAGVSAIAIADRLSRYNISIEEYQDKPRKEWYQKIPKSAIRTALALGLIGGVMGFSMLTRGRPREHIPVDPTEFEFRPFEGERGEFIYPVGGGTAPTKAQRDAAIIQNLTEQGLLPVGGGGVGAPVGGTGGGEGAIPTPG